MEPHHVDRAALPELVERHLDRGLPPGAMKERHDAVDQTSMRGVEQPVEPLAAPLDADLEVGAELLHESIEDPEGDAIQLAALDLRH